MGNKRVSKQVPWFSRSCQEKEQGIVSLEHLKGEYTVQFGEKYLNSHNIHTPVIKALKRKQGIETEQSEEFREKTLKMADIKLLRVIHNSS